MKVSSLLKNDSIVYSALKYITYGTGILKTIILAEYLGATLFGVWSFALLLLQYLSYSNFGAQFVVNNELPKFLRKKNRSEKIVAGTFQITVLTGLIVGLGLISFIYINPDWLQKYDIKGYLYTIVLLGLSQNINRLHINTLKSFGDLKVISVYELLNGIVFLPLLLFGIHSINLLLSVWLIYSLFMNFYLAYLIPRRINFLKVLDLTTYLTFFKKGGNLVIINVSLISVIILVKTFVSIYESVEVLGTVSLAISLSVATVTLTQTLVSAFFPKLLDKFKNLTSTSSIDALLNRISNIVIPLSFSLVLLSAIAVLLFSSYFDSLERIAYVFIFFGLGYNGISLATGFDILLYSKDKDFKITAASILSVIVCILGLTIYYLFLETASIKWMGMIVLVSYLTYFLVMRYETEKIGIQTEFVFKNIALVLLIYLVFIFYPVNIFTILCLLVIYSLINYKSWSAVLNLVSRIINNPDIHKIDR